MQTNLYVFSTTRAIREFIKSHLKTNSLLPKAITIGEFEKNIVLVKNRKKASDIWALLLMRKACKNTQNLHDKLGIPKEFFAFLKNSDYIFSFFKELSNEGVEILSLQNYDTYANFDEHLKILDQLYKNYINELEKNELYDDITLPNLYEINEAYVKRFSQIFINIDGVLSNFEWDLITKISSFCEIIIKLKATNLNQKTYKKVEKLYNLNLKENMLYEINLNKKCIINSQPLPNLNHIYVSKFDLYSTQCAFVFERISHLVNIGINPSNIVVILPDESFSEVLKIHDRLNMLNFAMGSSFKHTLFFQKLSVFMDILDSKFDENNIKYFKDSFNISDDILNLGKKYFLNSCDYDNFTDILNLLCENLQLDFESKNFIENEKIYIKSLLKFENLNLKEILELLKLRLANKSLSITGGGEVTVQGILESRSLQYEAVIVVSFNDHLVPKRDVGELFLNSQIRQKAGLVTYFDRENLQRFYYKELFRNAKHIYISYIEDEQSMKSRFLDELSYQNLEAYTQKSYLNSLCFFKPNTINLKKDEIVLKHDFFKNPLSFSRLECFLECKRMYFYKYIENLYPPNTNEKPFGTILHNSLKNYYDKHKIFDKNEFEKIFLNECENKYKIQKELILLSLDTFEKNENQRFSDGWGIFALEKELNANINGVNLKGIIDRIDVKNGNYAVIDYKSGKIKENSFQLAFYELLSGANESYYYDLKDTFSLIKPKKTKSKEELKEKLDELKTEFQNRVNFERNLSKCEYCPYTLICKKELI